MGGDNDTVFGGVEDDILRADSGNGIVGSGQGGLGNDTFRVDVGDIIIEEANASIVNFISGVDKIVVSVSKFGGGLVVGDAIAANQFGIADSKATGTSASVRLIYDHLTAVWCLTSMEPGD